MNYFTEEELSCKCGCGLGVSDELVEKLNVAREVADIPFIVTSGARCEARNEEVGGSPTSSHVKGLAVDLRAVNGYERFKVLQGLIAAGFDRVGVSKTFIHADVDEDKVGGVCWLY